MHSLIYLKPFTLPKLNAAREEYPCEIELRNSYLENPRKYVSKFEEKLKFLISA